jgi:hypothetical protein
MHRHNYVDVVEQNIFGLATEEKNPEHEVTISHNSYLTSKFSYVYRVTTTYYYLFIMLYYISRDLSHIRLLLFLL